MTQTVVIGAGQAGLAVGAALRRRGVDPILVDAGDEVGASWRDRYDSLVLFTPSHRSALPGLPFPMTADRYPTRADVAAYLRAYAEVNGLRIELRTRVSAVRRRGPDFVVSTDRGDLEASQVVVATGALHQPQVPAFARDLADGVYQLHSSEYRRAADLPAGDILVVGAGNSGAQIACELADAGRSVEISFERLPRRLPQRFLGRDVFDWLHWSGALSRRTGCRGPIEAGSIPLIGTNLPSRLRLGQIGRRGRAVGADAGAVAFADQSTAAPAVVLWATGFRHDFSWIRVPEAFARGVPIHERGVSTVPGLCFVGLPCLYTKGSALLGYVGRDAEFLASRLT